MSIGSLPGTEHRSRRVRTNAHSLKPWLVRLARVGYASRAVLYILFGMLAWRRAARSSGQVDFTGAFLELRHDVGPLLLAAMAAGLMGYAIWRSAEAVANPERRSLLHRTDIALRGGAYAWLAVDAVRFAFAGSGAVDRHPARHLTGALVSHPFGPVVLSGVGVILLWVAATEGRDALKGEVSRHLVPPRELGGAIRWMSRIGMATRMVLFGVIAGSFLHAAVTVRAHDAFDISDAVQQVTNVFGTVGLALLGAGLIAYGGYLVALAEWRRLPI
jgi:hypothetical protein